MEHKDISEVYEYIRRNRGVGHTTLLKDGALNATYPYLIVGADLKHARMLANEVGNEFAIPVSIQDTNKFKGVNYPVLIDNHTFTTSVDAYVKTVRIQREEIIIIQDDLRHLKISVEDIKALSFWKRLFKYYYIKSINKITNG